MRRGYRPGIPVEHEMDPRRTFRISFAALFAVVALALLSACSTVGALLGDDLRFTPMQLQHSLDRNFPRHYDKLGGLVSLTLMNPRLAIPEDGNRLRLDFDLGLGALGSDSSKSSGHFALTSAPSPRSKSRRRRLPSCGMVSRGFISVSETRPPSLS